jgi:hypothetical protein
MPSLALPKISPAASKAAVAWLSTLVALVPLCWLLYHGQFNALTFVMFLLPLVAAVQIDKPWAICIILTYLFLLGDIRRIVGITIGFPKFDLLLVVGPVVTILVALPLLMRLRLRDAISKAMVAFMAVMLLEIVNPKQGGLAVGIAGSMFYLLPILWFWIGRTYATPELLERVIYRVVVPLSVLASLLGLWQTYVGFLPWESAWISAVASHYHALGLGGGFIRAIGFSVNSVEYSNLQLIGCTCVLAAFFAGKRAYGLLFPLLAFTLFLASSRTSIVKLLFAVAAAWAISSRGGKGWAVRLPIALATLFGVLAFALSQVGGGGSANPGSAAGFSAQHQVQGLAHPLDSKKSTAGLHAMYFWGGIKEGITYPVGYGLGSITGGQRLGDSDDTSDRVGNTEVDLSDTFVTMGLLGGFLYLYIILLIVRRTIYFGRNAPKAVGLPTLAVLAAMVGSWIALGQYAMGPLIWFMIGGLVRFSDPVHVTAAKAVAWRQDPRYRTTTLPGYQQ